EGSIAVPAKLLLETLKTFPEQPLTFVVESYNTIELSSNHGKYALAYANGDEFPNAVELKEPSSTIIQGDVLSTAISKTIFASGEDDQRTVISGEFFELSRQQIMFVYAGAH